MTASPRWTIWCDSPTCATDLGVVWIGQEETATQALAMAKRFGWRRVSTPGRKPKDYCPTHAEAKR